MTGLHIGPKYRRTPPGLSRQSPRLRTTASIRPAQQRDPDSGTRDRRERRNASTRLSACTIRASTTHTLMVSATSDAPLLADDAARRRGCSTQTMDARQLAHDMCRASASPWTMDLSLQPLVHGFSGHQEVNFHTHGLANGRLLEDRPVDGRRVLGDRMGGHDPTPSARR
jgi:hypothetical protein